MARDEVAKISVEPELGSQEWRKLLALRVIETGSGGDIASVCQKLGISRKRFTESIADPLFFDELWNSSMAHLFIPAIPEIVQRWRDRCLSGDVNALKLFLSVSGRLKGEEHRHVHLHREVQGLEGVELDRRIAELKARLESVTRD